MIQFKTKEQAEQYLKLINVWIPFKLKKRGEHILRNDSKIIGGQWLGKIEGKGDWTVWKEVWTQEMLDDIKNFKFPDIAEMEDCYLKNEDRKQKLDDILDNDSEPTPFQKMKKQISDNILKNLENVRKSKSKNY